MSSHQPSFNRVGRIRSEVRGRLYLSARQNPETILNRPRGVLPSPSILWDVVPALPIEQGICNPGQNSFPLTIGLEVVLRRKAGENNNSFIVPGRGACRLERISNFTFG